jgi:hypothetical protein
MLNVNVRPKYLFRNLALTLAQITIARTMTTPARLGRFPRIDKKIARST